ncbi:uncharacterized protein FIBRA_03246 [Fibroporia radiculosa]|uniref:Cytochrome P450 n=1 Tax=Fibroporia radiculosa TaxID=599839 RepID=J4G4Q8_9APHY|nr:uncharacterized protein FIBRA_03246 [Fibroporia radiculosa]CCM01198.1 predicted protein [Fibroporia radiculosa]
MSAFNTLSVFAFLVIILVLLKRWTTNQEKGRLPPGPRGLPFVGNLLDLPSSYAYKTFTEWGEKWGDIISLTLFGQPIVILNSMKHVTELLDRRSALYSDRPTLTVAGKMVGWDRIVILTPYGPRLREYRRLLMRWFGSRSDIAHSFGSIMEDETAKFMVHLMERPDTFFERLRKTATATALRTSYGYHMRDQEDPLVNIVETAMSGFSALTTPGAFLADSFPILQHVPDWLPGTAWKKTALHAAQYTNAMIEVPYKMVKERMAAGTAIPSFTSMSLDGDITEEHQKNVMDAAGAVYAGGSDTSVSTLHSFFLAMMCYPEVQKKAQAELDAVIGSDRLPNLGDRDSLPFINAICTELHRWNPVNPLGVPHSLTEDDVYMGYLLPKGTTVLVNVWKVLHDPTHYKKPLEFNPERHIATESKEPEFDPRNVVFGFGRRFLLNDAFYSGDIISVTLFGQPIVILNSSKHALELLDRRGTLYSDRPVLTVAGKIAGWDQTLVLLPYGSSFREYRRMTSRWIGTRRDVARIVPTMEFETSHFLVRLARHPDSLIEEVRRTTGAVILKMIYGYEVQENGDPLVDLVDTAVAQFSALTAPGAFLADFFPILEHIPMWFPGADWKKRALRAGRQTAAMFDVPYDMVTKQIAEGCVVPSFTSTFMEANSTPKSQHDVKSAAASLYAGGADTACILISRIFLANASSSLWLAS